RTGKTVGGATTQYVYDGLNIVQEKDGAGTPMANLVTGLGLDETFLRLTGSGATASVLGLLPDANNNTLYLVNTSGTVTDSYSYEPYGTATQFGTDGTTQLYTGRENDGTGLYYYRARYYHPGFGRFISEDPIEFEGGPNLYAYVGGNPISWRDPHGLDYWDRYNEHVREWTVDVGPYVTTLAGGLWPKSWSWATEGRPPALGSTNPLTSVPRAFGVPGAGHAAVRASAAAIGVATVGIGFYNLGVFASGLFYAMCP
ncbi:MAG TPA: RHS repeat-associated core domain-containing protein, partial [Burkholderiales bacterium]|nr:RHS repeat-associated core domain-containing protein [Burkholderiales bacterium]